MAAAFGAKLLVRENGIQPRLVQCIHISEAKKLYKGDLVTHNGASDSSGRYAQVKQYTAADGAFFGVVVGIIETKPSGNDAANLKLFQQYGSASTVQHVLVCDDPDQEYIMQEDSVGGNLAAADVGLNVDVAVGTGNDPLGLSGMQIDSSSKNTTATLPLRLVRLHDDPDNNAIGTNGVWVVRPNNIGRSGRGTGA